MTQVFVPLGEGVLAESHGQKAALLSLARARGFAVPEGFALSGEQTRRLVAGDVSMRDALAAALDALGSEVTSLAVLSSPRACLPGALLTKGELMARAWPDVVVGDEGDQVTAQVGESQVCASCHR